MSWNLERAYEREEDAIYQAYESGEIGLDEYKRSMKELRRDYEGELQEMAEAAYMAVMEGNW